MLTFMEPKLRMGTKTFSRVNFEIENAYYKALPKTLDYIRVFFVGRLHVCLSTNHDE